MSHDSNENTIIIKYLLFLFAEMMTGKIVDTNPSAEINLLEIELSNRQLYIVFYVVAPKNILFLQISLI